MKIYKPLGAGLAAALISITVANAQEEWTGDWEGQGDGSNISMNIALDEVDLLIDLSVGSEGCGGGVVVYGVPENGVVEAAGGDTGSICRVQLNKRGDVIDITEGEGCSTYHGFACTFSGRVSRVGSGIEIAPTSNVESTGSIGDLLSTPGLYGYDLLANDDVSAIARRMTGGDFAQFNEILSVSGPVEIVGSRYVYGQGCRPHQCDNTQALVVVDTQEQTAWLAMRDGATSKAWPMPVPAWPETIKRIVRTYNN